MRSRWVKGDRSAREGEMHQRRRYRSVLAVSAAVVAACAAIALLAHNQPNYSRIEEGLYLGGSVAAPPPGTRAVLNLCKVEDCYEAEVHRWEPIHDGEPAPNIDWLRHQVEFIDSQRKAGLSVYVHCKAGISRAGLVTTAYLMWRNGWPRDRALRFVRSRRSKVRPNPAFMGLLLEWEQYLARRAA
jgi:hypothetical protein